MPKMSYNESGVVQFDYFRNFKRISKPFLTLSDQKKDWVNKTNRTIYP